MVTRTTSRRPAAKRPVAPPPKKTAAKPAPARKAAAPAPKARPVAKAPAARSKPQALAADAHPTRKSAPTGYDVVRAIMTAVAMVNAFAEAYQEELDALTPFVAPMGKNWHGALPAEGPLQKVAVDPEDSVIGEALDRDDTLALPLRELRELAADLAKRGIIQETMKKPVILAQMEEAGLFREDGDPATDEDAEEEADEDEDLPEEADDADEDDDEDDDTEADDDDDEGDDEEYGEYTRAELREMTLKEVQELAEANGIKWKGKDQEYLVVALLPDEDEEEEEEEEEDGEALEIYPDELPNMDLPELLSLCEQAGWEVPAAKKKRKQSVIDFILSKLDDN
jgi:hypothetical protein